MRNGLVTLSNGVTQSSDSLMKKSSTIGKKLSRRLKKTIMAIDAHNTNQAGGAQLNTQTSSQTNSQSAIQPQQTGGFPFRGD